MFKITSSELHVQNYWPKKRGNGPKKTGNESNVNIAETNPKYLEIPQHFSDFEGFPIIFEKKKETDPNSLLGPIPCWGVSIAPIKHSSTLLLFASCCTC